MYLTEKLPFSSLLYVQNNLSFRVLWSPCCSHQATTVQHFSFHSPEPLMSATLGASLSTNDSRNLKKNAVYSYAYYRCNLFKIQWSNVKTCKESLIWFTSCTILLQIFNWEEMRQNANFILLLLVQSLFSQFSNNVTSLVPQLLLMTTHNHASLKSLEITTTLRYDMKLNTGNNGNEIP